MAFLTPAHITAMFGGAVTGAAKLASLGDASAIDAWIARADAEVVAAANRGGYSTVTATGPEPSSGAAFTALVAMAFDEFTVIAFSYGRDVDTGRTVGQASEKLYVDAPNAPRINLPGLERDPLGGSAGGEIANGSGGLVVDDTNTDLQPRFTRAGLAGFS